MMTPSPSKRYALEYAGHLLEVETAEVGLTHVARLFINGQQVDEQKAVSERVRLTAGDITVFVQWLWTGQVAKCVLIEKGDIDEKDTELEEIPLEPPVRSYAARLANFQRKYPTLYAFRHVLFAVLQVLIPLLGIGVIFRSLLPDMDIKEFFQDFFEPLRHWVTFTIKPLVKSAKWLLWALPILAALFITLEEIKRQQKKLEKPEKSVSPGSDASPKHQ